MNTSQQIPEIQTVTNRRRLLDPEYIIDNVCKYFRISQEEIASNTRKREILRPRQIAMYFIQKYTMHTLGWTGSRLGRHDHSTVINAIRVVNDLIDTWPDFKNMIEEIREQINGASCPAIEKN